MKYEFNYSHFKVISGTVCSCYDIGLQPLSSTIFRFKISAFQVNEVDCSISASLGSVPCPHLQAIPSLLKSNNNNFTVCLSERYVLCGHLFFQIYVIIFPSCMICTDCTTSIRLPPSTVVRIRSHRPVFLCTLFKIRD